jgi:hypothetical protein
MDGCFWKKLCSLITDQNLSENVKTGIEVRKIDTGWLPPDSDEAVPPSSLNAVFFRER